MQLYILKLFNSSKSELQVLFCIECQQPINYTALRDLPNKGKSTPKWKWIENVQEYHTGGVYLTSKLVINIICFVLAFD